MTADHTLPKPLPLSTSGIFSRTIRFKIVLWYMLVLALTLSAFSVFLYHNFSSDLRDDADERLRAKADIIAQAIDTYWETEKLDAETVGGMRSAFGKANNLNFSRIAQHWVEERSNDPKLISVIIEIFDAHGTPIALSRSMPQQPIFAAGVRARILRGEKYFGNLDFETFEKKILPVRALAMPVRENGNVAYVVRVATPLSLIQAPLRALRIWLIVLLPLTVLLTGIVGAFLAKLTLRPVDAITRMIRQITAENLKLRIPVPETKDEIERLARTFNDMLIRLETAFASQKQFTQDVSHELKTPLTILRGELEITLKRSRSREEYESVLASSLDEVEKIGRIVENLLVLSRFDNRETVLKLATCDLSALIAGVLEDIRVLALRKAITLSFERPGLLMTRIDEGQVRHLLLNILDNAIKYTPEKGNIAVTAVQDETWIRVMVSDTGIGIAPDEIEHIFDRFYRVDKSRSSSGFGLGLSIARSIAEAHRGAIEVKSQPGKGSSFIISFPATPA